MPAPQGVPISPLLEWLEADGAGGFASGTVSLERTRRYHALLLTQSPTLGRLVLVNGLEAWVETPAGSFPLSSQRYLPDVVSPVLAEGSVVFSPAPWPCWTFTLPDGGAISCEIVAQPGSAQTLLRWCRTGGLGDWVLHVRLLLSGRDYHSLHHENPAFQFAAVCDGPRIAWQPYPDLPAIRALTNGAYRHAPEWYRRFLYTQERDRGLDCSEDLALPGTITFSLAEPAIIILSAGTHKDGTPEAVADALVAAESARRAEAPDALALAAQSYRATTQRGQTLIAGFPWFTDWGRDTFIAMRGLLLTERDFAGAGAILVAWASSVSQGMLPNRFPDRAESAEYNAVDASLWFIVAAHEFLASGNPAAAVVSTLRMACEAILRGYTAGTRFGIAADKDGLLRAGVPGVQLTWMDAKTGDHVVTPRIGKPVEIQALWINALRIAGQWAPDWLAAADRALGAFMQRFPKPDGGLYDVVDADHVPGKLDASIRPNQVFACGGLPFPILTGDAARAVLAEVETHLLTPLGLRTLSPADAAYIGQYRGGPTERDGAYHQGTVWPWLMGPFVDAWLAVRGRTPAARAEARARFLPPLMAHLGQAGIGHVSEVADGDAPHTPGGCPFQAWSLGELIRVRYMLGMPA